MLKVSIIVPVYNTEPYLRRCLESIRNQTLQDIEIICVDDGSTDKSPEILDAYAQEDSRIRVLHKANEGLVAARKTGIQAATGMYAGYVDSDDWIDSDMYECLYQTASGTNADLVTCGYFLEGNYTTIHLDNVEEGFYPKERMPYLRDHTIYKLERKETGIRGGLWCKLFKTELLKKVQGSIPDSISIAEDKVCLLTYILECTSVYVRKKPLYHWCIRQNSMSHESRNSYLLKVQSVYDYLTILYEHPNFSELMRCQAEIYLVELLFLGINKRMGFQNKNMLWIDPYWMEQLPENAKIILYGAGELGEKYRKQMRTREDLKYLFCVDENYKELSRKEFPVESPRKMDDCDFDYIVITVKNREKAMKIREELLGRKIKEEKIIWCRQPEGYWKYIDAENLLSGKDEGIDGNN